jgi:hypothetical protein
VQRRKPAALDATFDEMLHIVAEQRKALPITQACACSTGEHEFQLTSKVLGFQALERALLALRWAGVNREPSTRVWSRRSRQAS